MTESAVQHSRLGIAAPIWLLITSCVVAVFIGSGLLLNLLRETLHYGCSFIRMGASEPGEFSCADGISYIAPGVFILGLSFVVIAFAIAVLVSARVQFAGGAGPARVLAGLALFPLALISWAAWFATQYRPQDAEPDAEYWAPAMLLASVLLACAAVFMVVLCVWPLRATRVRAVAFIGACAALLAATIAQPGVLIATIISAGLLAASLTVERSVRANTPLE